MNWQHFQDPKLGEEECVLVLPNKQCKWCVIPHSSWNESKETVPGMVLYARLLRGGKKPEKANFASTKLNQREWQNQHL